MSRPRKDGTPARSHHRREPVEMETPQPSRLKIVLVGVLVGFVWGAFAMRARMDARDDTPDSWREAFNDLAETVNHNVADSHRRTDQINEKFLMIGKRLEGIENALTQPNPSPDLVS